MNLPKIACLMMGLGLLSACATKTHLAQPATSSVSVSAKDSLASAVKSQMYRSFGYQTDIYVSNHARRERLADVSVGDSATQSCETRHDDAYVVLLKKAYGEKGEKLDLNTEYLDEQKTIKSAYQACVAVINEKKGRYEPFDFDAFYQENHALSADEKEAMFLGSITAHMANQMALDDMAQDEPSEPVLEAKKAELLDAYLLQPSHLSVSGHYRPLKGQFSVLPSIQYHAKNLHLSVNQPVHFDLNAGGAYLWADNFALANSQFLDKSLGDKWYNKWLFLPFNDGSLPDDFVKEFVKAYLNAKKESFLTTPSDDFRWINADELSGVSHLSDSLPASTLALMTSTPHIIQSTLSTKDKAYSDYVFYEVLYNTLTKKYPDLAIEQIMGYNIQTMERDIIDGESVITVRNAEQTADTDPSEPKMNAKMLMAVWLANINQKVQAYYASQDPDFPEQDRPQMSDQRPVITHYGLDGGRLSWVSQRYYLKTQLKGGQFAKVLSDEPMVIDVFTKIHQNPNQVKTFGHLPVPTAQNSVNLLTYKDEFLNNLKNGNDKYLQAMLRLILGGQDEPSEPELIDEP
ncbi:MAG: hypothetical protein Q3971_00685 [Moraxella sp.]|nr:hypothetical protein [Moraxella sp.]